MENKKIVSITVIVVLLIGVSLFFYRKKYALEKKIRHETLVVAFDQLPQTLNPLFEQNNSGLILLDPIFDGLSNRSGRELGQYENGLGTDFIQDKEKLNVYTVELDREKRWHDSPDHLVTARDVRFTVECIKEPKNNSPLKGRINQLIERVDIVDDFTVQVVFKENISPHVVRDLLSFKIIPETYFGKPISTDLRNYAVAQDFGRKPAGSGKYKVKEWMNNKIVFTSVKPVLPASGIGYIEAFLIHDQEKQVKMLIDNKVDLVFDVPPKLHSMLNQQGLKAMDYVPLHFYALAFNTLSPRFSDKEVRQAIVLGINKTELAKQIFDRDVAQFINKGPFPHNDDQRYAKFSDPLSYNQDKAKQMLGKKEKIKATLIYKNDVSGIMEHLSSKIGLMLKEIGVEVEPKGLGIAFDTQISNRNFELALINHSGFTDGYNIANLYKTKSPQNITGISSGKLDLVLGAWENSAFWEQRLPAAKEVHEQILDLSPYAYLFSLPATVYHSTKLNNVMIKDPNALLGAVDEWTIKQENN